MKSKVENGEVVKKIRKILISYSMPDSFLDHEINKWKEFITNALNQQRRDVIREIRKWTKGKEVTKDKLREFLTNLEYEDKD